MRPVIPSFMTAAIVCSVVACGGKQGQQAPATLTPTTSLGEVNAPAGTSVPGAGAFKAEINPTNNGTVTGIATMSGSQGGNTTVIAMTLGGPRGTYIWHIHEGKCGNIGVLMGDKSNYPARHSGRQWTDHVSYEPQFLSAGGRHLCDRGPSGVRPCLRRQGRGVRDAEAGVWALIDRILDVRRSTFDVRRSTLTNKPEGQCLYCSWPSGLFTNVERRTSNV